MSAGFPSKELQEEKNLYTKITLYNLSSSIGCDYNSIIALILLLDHKVITDNKETSGMDFSSFLDN